MELQLLFLGVVLLLVEGFIPGFGIFGISGILCLLGALYFFLGATAQAAALVGGVLADPPGSQKLAGPAGDPPSPVHHCPGLYGQCRPEGSGGQNRCGPDGAPSFRTGPDRWGTGGCDHRRGIL